MTHLDHVVVFVADADRSLAFYRDGLGLAPIVDREFDGPWPDMFGGVTSRRLRAMILGDPAHPDRGQVELLTLTEPVATGPGHSTLTRTPRGFSSLCSASDSDST